MSNSRALEWIIQETFKVFSRVSVDSGKSRNLWLLGSFNTTHYSLNPSDQVWEGSVQVKHHCSRVSPVSQCFQREITSWTGLSTALRGSGKPRAVRLLRNFPFANHGWNNGSFHVFQRRRWWISLCFVFDFGKSQGSSIAINKDQTLALASHFLKDSFFSQKTSKALLGCTRIPTA